MITLTQSLFPIILLKQASINSGKRFINTMRSYTLSIIIYPLKAYNPRPAVLSWQTGQFIIMAPLSALHASCDSAYSIGTTCLEFLLQPGHFVSTISFSPEIMRSRLSLLAFSCSVSGTRSRFSFLALADRLCRKMCFEAHLFPFLCPLLDDMMCRARDL